MNLPRETCPACGRSVAVRKGGELREHRPAKDIDLICSASGMTVDVATLVLTDRVPTIRFGKERR